MNSSDQRSSSESARSHLLDTIWNGRVFSGHWKAMASRIPARKPATAELLGEVGESQASEIEHYVANAEAAQTSWAATSAEARAVIVRRAGRILEENRASSSVPLRPGTFL